MNDFNLKAVLFLIKNKQYEFVKHQKYACKWEYPVALQALPE